MRKGPLENSVEKHLVDRVEKELGGMALKGDVPGRRFLDRILILPRGVTVYCECKRPQGGRYSRHQLETAERLVKLGHWVLFVRDKRGVDEALYFLRSAVSADNNVTAAERVRYYAPYLQNGTHPTACLASSETDVWSLPHE